MAACWKHRQCLEYAEHTINCAHRWTQVLKSYWCSAMSGPSCVRWRVIRVTTILRLKSFPTSLRRQIGLYPEWVFRSFPGIGIRTSLALFQSTSNLPILMHPLRMRKCLWPSVLSAAASIWSGTPSDAGTVFFPPITDSDSTSRWHFRIVRAFGTFCHTDAIHHVLCRNQSLSDRSDSCDYLSLPPVTELNTFSPWSYSSLAVPPPLPVDRPFSDCNMH